MQMVLCHHESQGEIAVVLKKDAPLAGKLRAVVLVPNPKIARETSSFEVDGLTITVGETPENVVGMMLDPDVPEFQRRYPGHVLDTCRLLSQKTIRVEAHKHARIFEWVSTEQIRVEREHTLCGTARQEELCIILHSDMQGPAGDIVHIEDIKAYGLYLTKKGYQISDSYAVLVPGVEVNTLTWMLKGKWMDKK